jgi:hypothetical protein
MGASGAVKDYGFGQKKHWRRTQWNQILERTRGREKSEPILYLAGPDDNDRAVAVSKGVPAHSLIAIDRDEVNVGRVKAGGHSAIQADVETILRSWPRQRKVCALMLDFCSGLEGRYRLDLREPLLRTPFAGAAVMLNFQRGRDKSSENLRQNLLKGPGFLKCLGHFPQVRFASDWSMSEKNRAGMFIFTLACDLVEGAMLSLGFTRPFDGALMTQTFRKVFEDFSPFFYSYQSGNVVFDSVVFTVPQLPDGTGLQDELGDAVDYGGDTATARRISAMLAIRTSRMRGHI